MFSASPWKDSLHGRRPSQMSSGLFAFAIAFLTLAFWVVIEVNISILRQFKKRRSLYFWSLLVFSWGVFFHTLGYLTAWWAPGCPWYINTCFILFGWSAMITGQSLVLYSRLHLLILNQKIIRAVLILIITTAICIQIPQWVATWGATVPTLSVTKYWTPIDSIVVRISQAVFLIQESLLSGLYIWGAIQMLTPMVEIKLKKVLRELIAVSAFLVIMDIVILALAYTNQHVPKEPVQNFSYALKLKLEFFVLNQLVGIVQRGRSGSQSRYVKDSHRKKSGGPFGFGSTGQASIGKDGFALPIMEPPRDTQQSGSDNSSGSIGSAEATKLATARYPKEGRQAPRDEMRRSMDRNKVAWVTKEVNVTNSPWRGEDMTSERRTLTTM